MKTIIYTLLLFLLMTQQSFSQSMLPATVDSLDYQVSFIHGVEVSNDAFQDIIIYGNDSLSQPQLGLYVNQQDGTFSLQVLNIQPLQQASFAFADLNNDNAIDMLISGKDGTGNDQLLVYYNTLDSLIFDKATLLDSIAATTLLCEDFNNDGHKDIFVSGTSADTLATYFIQQTDSAFVESKLFIDSLEEASFLEPSFLAVDYNHDSFVDLLVSGREEGSLVIKFYTNQGNFSFQEDKTNIEPLENARFAAGDYNSDGKVDLLSTGENNSAQRVSSLYLQDDLDFTAAALALPSVSGGKISLIDFDHNGLSDMLFSGTNEEGNPSLQVYFQHADTITVDSYDSLLSEATVLTLADIDNNGNPDIFYAEKQGSSVLYLLRNQVSTNPGPASPTGPNVVTIGDKTYFSWNAPEDDSTASAALTYQLYVRDAEIPDYYKISPEYASKAKKKMGHGSIGYDTEHIVTALPSALYYWGVAGVDNAFQMGITCEGAGVCFELLKTDTLLCAGTSIQLHAEQEVDWYSERKGFLETSTSLNYSATSNDIVYYATKVMGSCDINYSLTITTVDADSLIIPSELSLCPEEGLSLELDSLYTSVRWYSSHEGLLHEGNALNYIFAASDTLWVEAQSKESCMLYDTLAVDVFGKQDMIAEDTIRVFEGESVQLEADTAMSYLWSPDLQLSEDTVQNPIAAPSETTTYFLSGTDLNGCTFYDSITVLVEKRAAPPEEEALFIPNLFSPNGDGNNDRFYVYSESAVENFSFQVYDREGTKLFETTRLEEGWDGQFKGHALPNGLYLWRIAGSFRGGSDLHYEGQQSGMVRLVR